MKSKEQKDSSSEIPSSQNSSQKRKYQKPNAQSESLMAFGALCNGTAGAGRKASTGAPGFCNASKLLS